MILLAPHIAAFLQQRLPIERRASPNTCDSYAHAFRLLLQYASTCIKTPPSQLQLEQLDAPLIVNFLNHLETSRGNSAGSRNIRLAAIKSLPRRCNRSWMPLTHLSGTASATERCFIFASRVACGCLNWWGSESKI
jgi:hypothetical protein